MYQLIHKNFRAAVMALTFLSSGIAWAEGAAPRQHDSMAERTVACSGCHGQQGRATSDGWYPRIAGKPSGYLYNQLRNFRDGRRRNATMAYLLAYLPDDYLREIAEYFSRLDLPYPPPQPAEASAAELARGKLLALDGDRAHNIPACAACHGARLMGASPAVPALLGLPRDYLAAQLGSWNNGVRKAAAPDCMAKLVREHLNPDGVQAVTAWLAAQPVPANTHPDPALPEKPPLECGSMQVVP